MEEGLSSKRLLLPLMSATDSSTSGQSGSTCSNNNSRFAFTANHLGEEIFAGRLASSKMDSKFRYNSQPASAERHWPEGILPQRIMVALCLLISSLLLSSNPGKFF